MATWSYSQDPSSRNRDKVRFLVGDTDETDQLLTDQEVDISITDLGLTPTAAPVASELNTLRRAAANLADAIAINFARDVDTRNMSLSISKSQRVQAFKECARRLRGLAGVPQTEDGATAQPAEMFVGGLSISDKIDRSNNSDEVQPAFSRGMDDNPRVGTQDTRDTFFGSDT